jgi:hypothetical protein
MEQEMAMERRTRIGKLKEIISEITSKQAELLPTLGTEITHQSELLGNEQSRLSNAQNALLQQQIDVEKKQIELTRQQECLVIFQRALMEHQMRLTAEIRQKHHEIQFIQERIQDMAAEMEKLSAIIKVEEEEEKSALKKEEELRLWHLKNGE